MKSEKFIIFLIAALLAACSSNQPDVQLSVKECSSFPNGGRASSRACVLDGKAYVFAGRDANGAYWNDLWQYDPVNDQWTSLGASPMKARVNAAITAKDGKLYAGLGYSAIRAYNEEAYQRDWYEFTPSTGTWKRLADFPNGCTVAPIVFALDESIYAAYGCYSGFSRDVFRYDIAADTWTRLPDNTGRPKPNSGGHGALFNGLLYYGGGYDTHNLSQWYVADIAKDQWTSCRSIPGKGREFGACAAGKEHIYLFGGRYFAGDMTGGEVFDTYLRYAPDQDRWEWCGTMPCGRVENLIAFSINGVVYFGLGEDEDGKVLGTLYKIDD